MPLETSGRKAWFKKKSVPTPGLRVLTASAQRIDLTDKKEALQIKALRQGWQSESWTYRDAIGELRYAVNFLANCAARMRIFCAAYPQDGSTDNPLALAEVEGMPPEIALAAEQALTDLGRGRLAISGLMHALSTNWTVAGECSLLGQQDQETGEEEWTIRSVDELVVEGDEYRLREVPADAQTSNFAWTKLDPEYSIISRIWQPHPRFRILADSPMRPLIDDCEGLLIMRRMIRAVGRSRLAGAGLLFVPDELQIKVPQNDNEDPQSDPFLEDLTTLMITPIGDEASASAIVPIIIRGPAEYGEKIIRIDLGAKFGKEDADVRAELVGVIATGLDLPKEVIIGVADLNHWSAWQVDDNTFRHHVEPHVISCCDALTAAYLRPALEAQFEGQPDMMAWVKRLVFWYDPTELVTHPDRTADAKDLHAALVISDKSLRESGGFTDEDEPSKAEMQVRMIRELRNWPPNLVMAFLHQWDPSIIVPPMVGPPALPGISPTGVDIATAPVLLPAAAPSSPGLDPAGSSPGSGVAAAPPATPTPAADRPAAGPPPVTAAGAPSRDLSRRLVDIDRELRAKVQVAACGAMFRHLERAGSKLRTKVAKDETMRTKIAQRPNSLVASIMGEDYVVAMGVSAQDLMGGDWSSLKAQFHSWVEEAQRQSIDVACQIAGLSTSSAPAQLAAAAMKTNRDKAWDHFERELTSLGHQALYKPDPNDSAGAFGDLNPDTLVPTGTVRVALAIAGGTLPGE